MALDFINRENRNAQSRYLNFKFNCPFMLANNCPTAERNSRCLLLADLFIDISRI